jgi:hypothetical protein
LTTGKNIALSSLTGSPPYMTNNYQDVMAICRTYRNPDLFITFHATQTGLESEESLEK